jgi:hypothetical protein
VVSVAGFEQVLVVVVLVMVVVVMTHQGPLTKM